MAGNVTPAFLINGQRHAVLTPFDRGLAYGDGVFRTFLARQGKPRHWAAHYAKLTSDCQALGLVCPPEHTLLNDIGALCEDRQDTGLKIIVTRGEGARGFLPEVGLQPTRIVLRFPPPSYPQRNLTEGVRLHLCKTRLARQPALAGIKHLNRLDNVLARMEWSDAEIAEGVMLDQAGYVIECTASNIFMRYGAELLTPNLIHCGVAGVMRQHIMTHAADLGYRLRVAHIRLRTVYEADEMIICNSLFGAWQVRQMGTRVWPGGNLAASCRGLIEDVHASAD